MAVGSPRRSYLLAWRASAAVRFGRSCWFEGDCHRKRNANLETLVVGDRGDVPLVRLRWRWGNCSSRLTEFIAGGFHMRPRSGLRHSAQRPTVPTM